MKMIQKFLVVLSIFFLSLSAQAISFPALTGQVVDEAGILSSKTKEQILSTMMPNQQFVVVTLNSLQGYEIEEYSLALGRFWGIGSKDKNDGLLLVVAPNERQVRIEVGYGLESVITDAYADKIIRSFVLPAFKAGDYNLGVLSAVVELQKKLHNGNSSFDETARNALEKVDADVSKQRSLHKETTQTNPLAMLLGGMFGIVFILFYYGLLFMVALIPTGIMFIMWNGIRKIKNRDKEILAKISEPLVKSGLLFNAKRHWKKINILCVLHAMYLIGMCVYIWKSPDLLTSFAVGGFFSIVVYFLLFDLVGLGDVGYFIFSSSGSSSGSSSSDSDWDSSSSSSSFDGGGGSFGGGGASGRW